MQSVGRGKAKGQRKFLFWFFLPCHKIKILFQSWNSNLAINISQFWGITDLSWMIFFPWDLSVVMSAGILEHRQIKYPWWLLTWLVWKLALVGSSAGATTPVHVLFFCGLASSHHTASGSRAVKGCTQNWQSHFCSTLSPAIPAATEIVHSQWNEETSAYSLMGEWQGHIAEDNLWKYSLPQSANTQCSRATRSLRKMKPQLFILFVAPKIFFIKSFTWGKCNTITEIGFAWLGFFGGGGIYMASKNMDSLRPMKHLRD